MSLEAIILAAGLGTRMGNRPKALLKFEEKTCLEWVSQALIGSGGLERVSVVVGFKAEDVRSEALRLGLNSVSNPDYQSGLMSSLQAGIRILAPETDAALIALVDQPLIGATLVQELCAAFLRVRSQRGISLFRPVHAGRSGHPCLIGREHFAEILAMPRIDGGAAPLFRAYPKQSFLYPVATASVTVDLDRQNDLEEMRNLPRRALR